MFILGFCFTFLSIKNEAGLSALYALSKNIYKSGDYKIKNIFMFIIGILLMIISLILI